MEKSDKRYFQLGAKRITSTIVKYGLEYIESTQDRNKTNERYNQKEWRLINSLDTLCLCGKKQTIQHIITFSTYPHTCTSEGIQKGTSEKINVARF